MAVRVDCGSGGLPAMGRYDDCRCPACFANYLNRVTRPMVSVHIDEEAEALWVVWLMAFERWRLEDVVTEGGRR
jgi:hypothetical protein